MKKLLSLLLAALMILGCCAAPAEESAPALQKDLIILFTSDVHCGVDQGWGMAGLYAVRENLSRSFHVLLVDDGDAIQGEPLGSMTKGEGVIDVMNAMGYDIAIPGNHEFDYGVDRLLELAEKASFPYISCNFHKEGRLVFDPYVIREIDGVKIGFVGITTPESLRSSNPQYFMDENRNIIYGFMQEDNGQALYGAVQKAVDEARAEGARYVVALAHLGNEENCAPWRYNDVIANTTGIDALLDGHSHDTDQVIMKNRDGKDVVRSACGTKMEGIGMLMIPADGPISSQVFLWNQDLSAPELMGLDNPGKEAVTEATRSMKELLDTVVAHSSVDLVIHDPEAVDENGKPIRLIRRAETNLGDLCADAVLDQAEGADIAFINGGCIRVPVQKGEIRLSSLLSVHPFGNILTVIEVTGQQVLDALEWSVHSLPGEFGGFNQVSGMSFEVDATLPTPCLVDENSFFAGIDDSMERRVRNVMITGEPLDPEKTYRLAGLDYQLLNHGDGYTMYDGAPVLQNAIKADYQALMDYIAATLDGQVDEGYEDPYGQERIVSVGAEK